MPAVSVVMAVWNGAGHLAETLDAISSQTLDDLELIVVDNASTDETPDLLERHGDDRVRVIRLPENRGPGGGLRVAVDAATAPFVAVHDHDDISVPARLERQHDHLVAHPELVALGSSVTVLDDATGERFVHRKLLEPPEVGLETLSTSPFAHGSLLLRADAVRRAGNYPADARFAADYDLIARLAVLGPMANLDEPLYVQRRHEGSVTGSRHGALRAHAREVNDRLWERPRAVLGHGPIDLDAYLGRPDGEQRLHHVLVRVDRVARRALRARRPLVAAAVWRLVWHSPHARRFARLTAGDALPAGLRRDPT